MSRGKRWRFAFQITEGPNEGLAGGSWRLWAHNDDVYLASAQLVNTLKVSLHASGRWRAGYTDSHMATDHPLWPRGRDRAAWRFTPPPFKDGVQESFVVAVDRGALQPTSPDPREAVVPVEDRWDAITGVQVLITEPDIDLESDYLVFDTPFRLDNGRGVWLARFRQLVPAADPEPVPAARIVRVLAPETDDVSCPGYLLVGARVA